LPAGIDAIELITKGVAESGSTDSAGINCLLEHAVEIPRLFRQLLVHRRPSITAISLEEIVMSEASTARTALLR